MRFIEAIVLTGMTLPPTLAAQSLAERVAATRDGAVTFHYASREGICGDGEHFIRIGQSYMGSVNSFQRNGRCDTGPVQVRLTLREGLPDRVETWVGRLKSRDAKDVGEVRAPDAARYLLRLASTAANGSVSTKAILGAVLADSATVWPELLKIARDTEGRSHGTRQDAAFWLSRFAAGALEGKAGELPADDTDTDGKDDLKTNAVFVLSQLRDGTGVPSLLDVARTNKDASVRRSALFWLGQSGDARALDLFESLLH